MRIVRALRRQPIGFWLVAAVLGLAVGATAAIATIVDVLILRPIPVPEPERLVVPGGLAYGSGLEDPPEYWAQANALESLALYRAGDVPVKAETEDDWTRVAEVSSRFFQVFRTPPAIGRSISHDDELQSVDVAVVSDSLWRNRLQGRGDVLGQKIRIGSRPYTIVGVAPRGFDFPPATKVWIPRMRVDDRRPTLVEGASELAVVRRPIGWVGRIRDGASVQQLQSQLEALLVHANEVLSRKTGVQYGEIINLQPLVVSMSRGFQPTLWTLMAGAAIVLIVATSNCALFALGVFTRRRTEWAVRQVLGASPRRLAFELIGDATMIGIVSGAIGLVVAASLLRIAEQSLHAFGVEMNARPAASAAALGLSLALGLLSGLVGATLPALRARRPDIVASLANVQGSSPGRRDRAFRRGFTVVQIASAVVLTIGAITTGRTLLELDRRDLGQTWHDVAVVRAWMPRDSVGGKEILGVQRALVEQARSLPGVVAAASVDRVTLETRDRGFQQVFTQDGNAMASITRIAGDYFRVMGIRIVVGRPPSSTDASEAVVNETLSRKLWPATNPVGQSLAITGQPPVVVTGVARDVRAVDQDTTLEPEVYVNWAGRAPEPPGPPVRFVLVAKCASASRRVLETLHQELTNTPGVKVYATSLGDDLLQRTKQPANLRAFLWTAYAILAAGVATIGIAAVVAFAVTLRRYEIGVRLAIGSTRKGAIWLVAGEGAVCACLGILVGAVASRWLATGFRAVVFGGQVPDWPTLIEASGAILLCSIVASILPALRVTGNEPLDLLRRT